MENARGLDSERGELKSGSSTFELCGPGQETKPFFSLVFSSGKWNYDLDLKGILDLENFCKELGIVYYTLSPCNKTRFFFPSSSCDPGTKFS